jgi:hypothetical protein
LVNVHDLYDNWQVDRTAVAKPFIIQENELFNGKKLVKRVQRRVTLPV